MRNYDWLYLVSATMMPMHSSIFGGGQMFPPRATDTDWYKQYIIQAVYQWTSLKSWLWNDFVYFPCGPRDLCIGSPITSIS